MTKKIVGNHILSNFYGVTKFDNQEMKATLINFCKVAGCGILDVSDYTFPNGGYTVIILLSESHASIHTYPENNSLYLDIFTCGETVNPEIVFTGLKEYFNPEEFTKQIISR